MIEGIIVTPLKKIVHPKGDIYHALKCSESSYTIFGEAYFSTILHDEVKGWKKHSKMVLNLIVPVGSIRFVIYDDRDESTSHGEFFQVILSKDNYCRLTIPAGVWMAFQGLNIEQNLLLNIASIEHDPLEAETKLIEQFSYDWSTL
jgi:dTDP-4-dehydrorhamnose 3,5-epimerase